MSVRVRPPAPIYDQRFGANLGSHFASEISVVAASSESPFKTIFTEAGVPSKLRKYGDSMKQTLSTIGYEGATIQEFVATLQQAAIRLVIDVRAVPLSRKKGFSKTQLSEYLRAHKIEYVHLRGLGDPKEGREAARAGNYALFLKIFGRHMRSDEAIEALEVAAELVQAQRACLMCYEADYEKCHRTIVADHLSDETGLPVTPLTAHDERAKRRLAA